MTFQLSSPAHSRGAPVWSVNQAVVPSPASAVAVMYFTGGPDAAASVPVPVSCAVASRVTGPGDTDGGGRSWVRNPIGVIPGGISGHGSDGGPAAATDGRTSTAMAAYQSEAWVQEVVTVPPVDALVAMAMSPAAPPLVDPSLTRDVPA